jgi:hypothetical protein
VNIVCYQVEVSAMGRSLVPRRNTECVCVCVCVCVCARARARAIKGNNNLYACNE